MTLKQMRQSTGYTQEYVAKIIPNTTQGLISQWESGECYPQAPKIQALAKLYGVTSDDIIAAITAAKEQSIHKNRQ